MDARELAEGVVECYLRKTQVFWRSAQSFLSPYLHLSLPQKCWKTYQKQPEEKQAAEGLRARYGSWFLGKRHRQMERERAKHLIRHEAGRQAGDKVFIRTWQVENATRYHDLTSSKAQWKTQTMASDWPPSWSNQNAATTTVWKVGQCLWKLLGIHPTKLHMHVIKSGRLITELYS